MFDLKQEAKRNKEVLGLEKDLTTRNQYKLNQVVVRGEGMEFKLEGREFPAVIYCGRSGEKDLE